MKNTFVLLWAPGPAWIEGKTVREQPYWAQHADFMDPLFENGTVVLVQVQETTCAKKKKTDLRFIPIP